MMKIFKSAQKTILAVMLLGTIFSCEQNEKPVTNENSAENNTIEKALDSVFKKNELMGMSVVLITNGEISYQYQQGLANEAKNTSITEETIYRVASISKSITATALMQLWDEGKVNLDIDVSNYLSWKLVHPKHPNTPITLRHLLSHQSGIRDGSGYGKFSKDMISEKLHIQELFTEDGAYFSEDLFADHQPGAYFSYTNCTWGIIVSVIENISKQRFDDYCRERIFGPLQMKSDFNVEKIEPVSSIAALYRFENNKWIPQVDDYTDTKPTSRAYPSYQLGQNGLLFGPQGSLRSSAEDLATFALMLMNNGTFKEKEVLKKETVAEMLGSQWLYNGDNGDTWENFFLSYGLGMHQITNKEGGDIIFPDRKMVGHPGIAYGLLSDMYFDSKSKSGIVFITNGSKKEYQYGKKTSFYQVEEDLFYAIYPFLKNLETN
ncbi:beta-lactamase family protein [Galbibacter sp. BG1]|uniref:serine hydrolase domain-containing protein n=1 Tax=Galbibacter sp. BG1 TaxID=1170699 RepID=UPI0015BA705C|nr:serine hydrolase domain-containing protein [Galbibacter sp. BG1]QLE00717.1 beta-lactamase family protein [Galbibacter sp. BG1]